MSYEIKIKPANIQYHASSSTTLLDGALSNKLFLQYSCKKGECGSCSASIIAGLVKNENGEIVRSGVILMCNSYAQSDVTLEANYYPELAGIECMTVPCKIAKLDRVTDDIISLTLRLPATIVFEYLSGQYIDLMLGGVRRSYSIANAQSTSGHLELHIRLIQNGEFSQLLKQSNINQLMRLEGPKGTFFVRDALNPLIFLAGGTGFAPVKAMVEQLLAQQSKRMIYIYWGMQNSASFYTDIANSWATSLDHVHYVPVLSSEEKDWRGRVGFVHQAVMEDFSNLSEYHVYACGSPLMIDAARKVLFTKELQETSFYSDAFVSSK